MCRQCKSELRPTNKVLVAVSYVDEFGEERAKSEQWDVCDDCEYDRTVLIHRVLDVE